MPIYMDLHIVPGVQARGVAEAHRLDLALEEAYNCKCMTYWVDESRGQVFCLIEAPNEQTVIDLHRQAHGLIPHKIIEVQPVVVESFLGRITDPCTMPEENGLPIIAETSYRVLLLLHTGDSVLRRHHSGETSMDAVRCLQQKLRAALSRHGGRQVDYAGDGCLAVFDSVAAALACASALGEDLEPCDARVGICTGAPVETGGQLFGDAIRRAEHLCFIARDQRLQLSSEAGQLAGNTWSGFSALGPAEESMLTQLFDQIEAHLSESDFDLEHCARELALSRSGLYRKVSAIAGLGPRAFVNEIRIDRSRQQLRERKQSIAHIAFENGYTSPSYFTKCFRKRYGLTPMEYLASLD